MQCEQSNSSSCLITGIRVFDADRYGKGGLAKITDGGLHHNNVTINFTSKPGECMPFTIIINGYCAENISNQVISNETNTQHANPMNNDQPIAPSYGWNVVPLNVSALNTSSVLVQNITAPSNSSWWHFWS